MTATLIAGLQYELYGAPGGTPVVLHHGLGESAVISRAWANAARAQGVELISVARPELVAPVLDELSVQRCGVWGVSEGAPAAYAQASADTDRVAAVAITSGLPARDLELSAITAPVRIWHSRSDERVPYATAQWMRELIPGAILQNQAVPGHVPSRDTVRAAMVFLSLRP